MSVKELIEELECHSNTCEVAIDGLPIQLIAYSNRTDRIELKVQK